MRILISNDDGIYSPGLAALAEVATLFGEVRIVAPDFEQSSMSGAISSNRPMQYRKSKATIAEAYRVNGTPADCVCLGLQQWPGVDLVLSGINLGTNLGNAIWHSGTLAAARQAALFGIRGIAFSTPTTDDEPEFSKIKPWVEKALRLLINQKSLPLVNVNVPTEPLGMSWTRQSFRHYDGKVVPQIDPMGREQYWYTIVPIEQIEEGTDRWAMARRLVSITPLRLDLTDADALKAATATPLE